MMNSALTQQITLLKNQTKKRIRHANVKQLQLNDCEFIASPMALTKPNIIVTSDATDREQPAKHLHPYRPAEPLLSYLQLPLPKREEKKSPRHDMSENDDLPCFESKSVTNVGSPLSSGSAH